MHKLNYLLAIAELKRVRALLWVGLLLGELKVPHNKYAERYIFDLFCFGGMPNPLGIKNERVSYA